MKSLELTNLETSDLCRELALLMHSGVTAGDGLHLLAEGEKNPKIKDMLQMMTASVDGGSYLSEAFEGTGAFSTYFTGLLQVGEQVGRSEETLNGLADYYEEKEKTERQLINSLTYPVILLLMMAIVIIILLSQVLPVFNDIYESLGGKLTGVAGGLLLIGQLIDSAIPALCCLLMAVLVALAVFSLNRTLRKKTIAFFAARLGDQGIFRKINNARFIQALAMGYTSGMRLEDAAGMASLLVKDIPAVQKRCRICIEMIDQGEDLAIALEKGEFMTPSASRVLTLGLRSGTGDSVMADLSTRMQEDARAALESTVARVEPALVVITSVLVGMILLSVMLPLMNIMTAIG